MRKIAAIAAVALSTIVLVPTAAAAPCAGFTDVDDSDPFCTHVEWIKNRNITLGCAAGLYCPSGVANRLAIAAFLRRLGDVVLPPNVIWVAPVGGMFQSIQAAIDYAASLPPSVRRLVKVAPGTYNEAITMVPAVDIEGSGEDATIISATVCNAGAPTSGTVTGASGAQLRNVTVSARSSSAGQCAAVYLDSVNGTALRNVQVEIGIVGSSQVYGVLIASTTPISYAITLDSVVIRSLDISSAAVVGIFATGFATGVPFASMFFRDVRISHIADVSAITAFRLNNAVATLDRATALIDSGFNSTNSIALLVEGTASDVIVERSTMRSPGGTFAMKSSPAARLRIANSFLEGSLSGAANCFSNYDANFVPVVC